MPDYRAYILRPDGMFKTGLISIAKMKRKPELPEASLG
jgi:hypothetical protein